MDDVRPKQADWAPGTLEKTRKAIGNIDAAEAMKMSKVLGGEVMYERTQDFSGNSKKGTGKIVRSAGAGGSGSGASAGGSSGSSGSDSSGTSSKGRKHQEELPVISQKLATQIDKLMMSAEYGIKPNYGFFNFIKYFQNNGHEQLITEFVTYTMKMHIENLQGFITVIKTMIQMAPASYKAKIANGTEAKFKFLRMVAGWTMQSIKLAHVDLQNLPQPYVTADLIPYTRAVYRLLIQVYYYGETKIPHLIKEIFADESAYPDSPKEKISGLAKEAITQWLYIQNEIIRKMYPLLMRMCSNTYEEYPAFFKAKVADILKFCGLHKYDLLLQEKPQAAEEEKKTEAAKKPAVITKGVKDGLVNSGLSILNNFFPQAGFDKLETHPDMYPYFQPLYKFADGFNCLSPENPLQVTMVLLRIIEDLLRGCRNIKFKKTAEEDKKGADSISAVMDDWINYREELFEQLYCEPLNNLVNQVYSQADFENTQFGKKLLSSLLWQTTYHFLPNFKFEKLLLEHPADEAKVRPLFHRTDFARQYLTQVVTQCDHLAAARGDVSFLENPWEHYKFDIPNEVSKRLDVMLGAQNKTANTTATNANLLKYTLCVISVLDWWINNPDSPAYSTPPMHIYRINPDDGKPQFSVEERHDQNKLFADQIRAAYQKS